MEKKKRKFILITRDWSGLGFAIQEIQKNGSEVVIGYRPKKAIEPDKREAYKIQGKNLVKTYPLSVLMNKRAGLKDAYWVFDGNHNVIEGELLRKEGFKVFGGSKFQHDLENDRELGIKFAESVGLHSPDYKEFKSAEEGIKFLEANEDKAYVFKPNGAEESALTQPFSMTPEPKNANLEARRFIKSMNINDFILQERKKGVEVNVELMFSKGVPTLAQANLECKRRHNGDLGYMTGCAMDVCWKIGISSRLVQMTVGKFLPKLTAMKYTGFCDANVIIGDDQAWFIEFCFRTGYNAHPNFFSTIGKKTYLQSVADMVDGLPVEAWDGFGASVTMFTDKEHTGIPIYVPERLRPNFFLFDGYKEKDESEENLSMGGFGNEIAIVTARNFTIQTAFQEATENAEAIKFVNKDYRTDGDKTDFPSSPIRRFEALNAMHLL